MREQLKLLSKFLAKVYNLLPHSSKLSNSLLNFNRRAFEKKVFCTETITKEIESALKFAPTIQLDEL